MNQEIIKLAEAGGYPSGYGAFPEAALLDKEFWIALGKQLNWPKRIYYDGEPATDKLDWSDEVMEGYRFYAHQFLDARFEGREQEFFKELIEKR